MNEKNDKFSEENKSYALFNKRKSTPEEAAEKKKYINELNSYHRERTTIRKFEKKDSKSLVNLVLLTNAIAENSTLFPYGKNVEEIVSIMKSLDVDENFYCAVNRNDQFQGFCGIDFELNSLYAKLYGPYIERSIQNKERGSELLKKIKEECKIKGIKEIQTAIDSKNKIAEKFLLKHGFAKDHNTILFQSFRASRHKIYRNSKDKVFILEPGDSVNEITKFCCENEKNCQKDENYFKNKLENFNIKYFASQRDLELNGLLELDMTFPKEPVINYINIHSEHGDEDLFRLLLVSAAQIAFRKIETISLKLMINEEKRELFTEVDKLGFRITDKYQWMNYKI